MTREINVGLIGYKFMGKAHSNALARIGMFFDPSVKINLKAICGREEEWVAENAKKFGFEDYETEWEKLVARDDIDVVDITAPSNVHKQIAIEAAKHGKHIFCEKPLALSASDAMEMEKAIADAGVLGQVGFNYRFCPAVMLAKKLICEGKLGRIFHFRGRFLQDWLVNPKFPLAWRLDKNIAGSGAHGDLGAHVIDAARFLIGEFDSVCGISETFIKERPIVQRMEGLSGTAGDDSPKGPVTVDDATIFLARFKCGAIGQIEATRFAPGHDNDMGFEINGEFGSLRFSFERMNELEYYDNIEPREIRGYRTIQCTQGVHPYLSHWWPAGHVLGYETTFVHEMYEFYECIANSRPTSPDFTDGRKCAEVLEAVDESIINGAWVKIPE
ncbi:MAG: Gfo/Idh/MocA family oxidoreductase [Eubacteriales bacterium]